MCKNCYQDRIEKSSNRIKSRKRENYSVYEWVKPDPDRDRESGIERPIKEAVEAKVLHDMQEIVGNAPLPVVAEVTSRLFTKILREIRALETSTVFQALGIHEIKNLSQVFDEQGDLKENMIKLLLKTVTFNEIEEDSSLGDNLTEIFVQHRRILYAKLEARKRTR